MVRERLAAARPGDADPRRGVRHHRAPARAALDRRPDRRHEELRPRHPGVGDAASALEVDGELVVGVVSAPALGRRWWAARGGGRVRERRADLGVEGRALEDAQLVLRPTSTAFEALRARRRSSARWPARCWRPARLRRLLGPHAGGRGLADIEVEPILAVWDLAALMVIVEEAGGRVTDLAGDAPRRRRQRGHDQRAAARRGARSVRARS